MAGCGMALAAAASYVVGVVAVELVIPLLLQRFHSTSGGAAGVFISSGPVLAFAAAGFAAGFYWTLRETTQ